MTISNLQLPQTLKNLNKQLVLAKDLYPKVPGISQNLIFFILTKINQNLQLRKDNKETLDKLMASLEHETGIITKEQRSVESLESFLTLQFTKAEKDNDAINLLFSQDPSDENVAKNLQQLKDVAMKFLKCATLTEVFIDKTEDPDNKLIWSNRLKQSKKMSFDLMSAFKEKNTELQEKKNNPDNSCGPKVEKIDQSSNSGNLINNQENISIPDVNQQDQKEISNENKNDQDYKKTKDEVPDTETMNDKKENVKIEPSIDSNSGNVININPNEAVQYIRSIKIKNEVSNVAQLKEDLKELNKAITGGSDQNILMEMTDVCVKYAEKQGGEKGKLERCRLSIKNKLPKTISNTIKDKSKSVVNDIKGCLNFRESAGACTLMIDFIEANI